MEREGTKGYVGHLEIGVRDHAKPPISYSRDVKAFFATITVKILCHKIFNYGE